MAITLYQEQIPFSNKKTDFKISSGNTYTNPVIMSFAFDFTICTNFLETVIYIRNDDINKYYKNVTIILCRKDPFVNSPLTILGTIKENINTGPYLSFTNKPIIPVTFSTETYTRVPDSGYAIVDQYFNDGVPVTDYTDEISGVYTETDENINVRFSYGYDELSNVEWQAKKPGLIIQNIGNKSLSDTSYIPIRMRMLWKSASSLFTIRDYFIDISYESERFVGED